MNEPEQMPASMARKNFMEVVSRARYGGERIVITNKGKPAAVVVPIEDLRRLEALEAALAQAAK